MNTFLMILALFLGNEDVNKTPVDRILFCDNYVKKVSETSWEYQPASKVNDEKFDKFEKFVIYYTIERIHGYKEKFSTNGELRNGKLRKSTEEEIKYWNKDNRIKAWIEIKYERQSS